MNAGAADAAIPVDPVTAGVEIPSTLAAAFLRSARIAPDAIAVRSADGSVSLTWKALAERTRAIAAGLAAAGVHRGDTVALMMGNRPEFYPCEIAAIALGAATVSIYNTSTVGQVAHVLGNAASRVVLCEQQFAERILTAAAGTAVERVVTIDGTVDGALTLEALVAGGEPGLDLEARAGEVEPDDVAVIIYTSGTTGPPKGVELTHATVVEELRALQSAVSFTAEDRVVSFLPSAHMADRITALYPLIAFGVQVNTVADARTIGAAIPQARPTVWGAVPRLYEKLKAGLEAAGVTDPSVLSPEHKAAVLQRLGLDEVRLALAGAAPTGVDVLDYFAALGLPVCEAWGMSELAGMSTLNPAGAIRPGTVGLPLPGVEVRLADDGELLCRGPMMRGYRDEPEKSAEAIDADGWLHTGDVATIDEDGYIRIVDRKKELIINASGKNMSPANIEARLKAASPVIGQAVCVGDRRPYNVALLVLDPDVTGGRAPAEFEDEIERAVATANGQLARVEQIKRYTVLADEWIPGGDELTPTAKLRRRPIAEKYAAAIDALYAPASQ